MEMMDSLSKEFHECFWDEIKMLFLASINKPFINEEFSNSQKHAVIKILGKKTKIRDSLRTGDQYYCLIQIWKL